MPASEARIQANRQNAQRSTGPETEPGKLASRGNAYKHGLTGSGVVASEEGSAAVARLSATLHHEMRPATALGAILVDRLAVLAVRLDRCARQESAAIAENVRNAATEFDEGRESDADALFARLIEPERSSDPAPLIRKLRRTPEGLARLVQGWVDLASALRQPGHCPWDEGHLRTFEALVGRRPTDRSLSRAAHLSRLLIDDDPSGLAPAERAPWAEATPAARASWARDRLFDLITAEVAGLEAANEDIDHEAIELDRAGAPARALFDTSREATLARKYEAAAERGFYRALREFQEAEAEAGVEVMPEPPAPPPSPPAEAPRGSLASFFPAPVAPVARDQPAPTTPRPGHVERTEERPESVGVTRPGVGGGR